MAERRNDEVMDMVDGRTHASWVKAGGTNNLQICSSTNDFDQARGLCSKRAKCASEDTTKVQILLIRVPGGGLLLAPKYSRGPAASRARWRCSADLADESASEGAAGSKILTSIRVKDLRPSRSGTMISAAV